ncbi:hypothetical protein FKM82_017334 [Ascaphus truei]
MVSGLLAFSKNFLLVQLMSLSAWDVRRRLSSILTSFNSLRMSPLPDRLCSIESSCNLLYSCVNFISLCFFCLAARLISVPLIVALWASHSVI